MNSRCILIFVLSEICSVTVSFPRFVTVPQMPDDVITLSPFYSDSIMAFCCFCFFCCGRINMK
jgi:multisubunit Na+/H+ antiporter MnhF subunit